MLSPAIYNVLTIGATAIVASLTSLTLLTMDANPTLFLYDKFRANNDYRRNEFFSGKTIWIVGASSGIGAEVARQLSYSGATVVLSSRPSDTLEQVAASCRRNFQHQHVPKNSGAMDARFDQETNSVSGSAWHPKDDNVLVVPFDLTGPSEELEQAVGRVQGFLLERSRTSRSGGGGGDDGSNSGMLDCIILNAGRGHLSPASQTSQETTEQMFQLNTLAPIRLTQLLFHRGILQEDKATHLVVTSSVGAKFGVPLSAAYAASKHALHGYLNSLQAEWPWLRVDLICPGPVDTKFHQNSSSSNKKASPEEDDGLQNVAGKEEDLLSSPKSPPRRELKMPVQRCASLLVSSIMMAGGGNNERWIAEQPTLLGLYINQHFPGIFQTILRTIGPLRVQAWKDGKNLYDPDTWKKSQPPGK
jgi:dehydrogenase/reductase SDR family member 7B